MDGGRQEESASEAGSLERGAERTRGLILETCYRHPDELTGVHCTRCERPICPDCMREAPVGYQCPQCVTEAGRRLPRRRARLVVGRPGSLVTLLIAANLAMFVVEVVLGGPGALLGGPDTNRLFDLGAANPLAIADGQFWRLFTAMFLHAGLIHIAFNMYGLYLFGYLIENAFSAARFLAVYLVGGLLASVTSFAFGAHPFAVSVGASGAVFALLGAWVAYNYRRRGSSLASANLQWALMLIGINLLLGFSIARIDNFAHIGGLVAGAVAGFFAEGFGPRNVRPLVRIGGFTLLIAVGVALVVWRTADLAPLLGSG
jgi:membrane associated rhomboid family serine protease